MIAQDEFRAEAFRNRAAKCSLDEYIWSVLGMVDEKGRRDRLVRCSTTSAHVTGHLQERRGVGILPVDGHHLPRQPRGRLPILNVCGFLELVEKPFNPSVDAFSSHQDSVPLLRPHRTKPSTKNNNDLGTERVGKESCYGEQLVWVGSGVGVPDTALR